MSSSPPSSSLLSGSVTGALREMTVPMLVGMVAMILVNLIDTYWVSQLGTDALAAMTFAFPVEAVVINVALGLMIGTSVAVARAIGSGHEEDAQRLTTDATLLAGGVVLLISGLGLLFQDTLFRWMGAEGPLLENVKRYMTPWFVGVAFLIVPMIANGALRAIGDARTPMRVMLGAAGLNALLDPVLIFGLGPVPSLGLQGAAIATVIARFVTMVVVFIVLLRHTSLLGLSGFSIRRMWASWLTVARVAVPASVTNAIGPFAVGLLTVMVAAHGADALAAWGIGARVDALLMLVPGALAGAVSPFVGQNAGARLRARVAEGLRTSLIFAAAWGVVATVLLLVSAPWVAAIFSDDESVREALITYLRIVPLGYAGIGLVSICSSAFNAVDRATLSTWLSVLRSLVFAVPLAWLGDQWLGMPGLLGGVVVASLLAAGLGVIWLRGLLYPYGTQPAGAGRALSEAQVVAWLESTPGWHHLGGSASAMLEHDNLSAYRTAGGRLGLYVGAIELLHLEPGGMLDLPLPVEVGENLVRFGSLTRHPDHDQNGWYRHAAEGESDTTLWLVGLSHLMYALSQRGADDPITQSELEAYTYTPQCVTAMRAASARWEERIAS